MVSTLIGERASVVLASASGLVLGFMMGLTLGVGLVGEPPKLLVDVSCLICAFWLSTSSANAPPLSCTKQLAVRASLKIVLIIFFNVLIQFEPRIRGMSRGSIVYVFRERSLAKAARRCNEEIAS